MAGRKIEKKMNYQGQKTKDFSHIIMGNIMESKDKIEFEVSGQHFENVKKFRKQHKNCFMGTCAEQFEYSFVPTSLGLAASIKCSCGQSMSLGDFMDYEANEYDEEKYKVLKEQDRINAEFENAAKMILVLRNPRIFRVAFRRSMTFESLYFYVSGLIRYADERIRKAFLYKIKLDKYRSEIDVYKDCDETEKIQKFFDYFIEHIKEEVSKYDCRDEQLLKYLNDNDRYDYNEDSLARWLTVSIQDKGYGLFSKEVWTSEELLPILEKFVE